MRKRLGFLPLLGVPIFRQKNTALSLLIIIILIFPNLSRVKCAELSFSLIEQNNIEQISLGMSSTWNIKVVENKLSYSFHKTTDLSSTTEIILNSLYPMQDVNIIGKAEYFRQNYRRIRAGIGAGKKWGIFRVNQYLSKDFNHNADDKNLFDTLLALDWQSKRIGLYYSYNFVTSFGDINWKYIKLRISNKLSEHISLIWSIDRRWESERIDINKLLLSVKF